MGDYRFIPVDDRLDWLEALAHCQTIGAELVTIENDEENDKVLTTTSTDYCETE